VPNIARSYFGLYRCEMKRAGYQIVRNEYWYRKPQAGESILLAEKKTFERIAGGASLTDTDRI
jgi:hypothetical protein